MKKIKVLFLTNTETSLTALKEAGQCPELKEVLELKACSLSSAPAEGVMDLIGESDLLLLFLSGGPGKCSLFSRIVAKAKAEQTALLPLTSPSEQETAFLTVSTVESSLREQVQQYFNHGGTANYLQLFLYLGEVYGGSKTQWLPPKPLPWQGFYHPELSWEKYLETKYCPEKPTIGLLFSRHEWVQNNLKKVDFLIREIEEQGANVIPVFSYSSRDLDLGSWGICRTVREYFFQGEKRLIDVLLTSTAFPLTASQGLEDKEFLSKLGVPVLQGITSFSSREEWQENIAGLSATDVAVSIALPEFDGALITVPVATKEKNDSAIWYEPLAERCHKYVALALNWAKLGKKANKEKKIAIILHNYPPTNARIGNAVGLDTPESTCLLLQRLQLAGYLLDYLPTNGQELMQDLLKKVTNDRSFLSVEQARQAVGKVDKDQYQAWYQSFPESNQQQLAKDWGPAPGEVFNYEDQLLIPGTLNGNIFLAIQPPRGFGEEKSKIYHDPNLAPPHHYLAYYRWLRDVFQADAVIHLGKHGSLEWLPGKGAGLSEACYPDLAIADLPNIYPYIINDPGEGTQAKRRSYACIIDHLPPAMTVGGVYESLAEIERTLEEYQQMKSLQPEKSPVLINLLWEQAKESNLHRDLKLGEALLDEAEFLSKLEEYLEEIKYTPIRQGLHIFGQAPQGEKLREFYLALLRLDNGEIPSLLEAVAAALQLPLQSEEVWQTSREMVETVIQSQYTRRGQEKALELLQPKAKETSVFPKIIQSVQYLCSHLAPSLQLAVREMDACLQALAGGYVDPGPSGAPTRGMADILPTGRNFYSVDPRAVPTRAAWQVGKTLAEELLARHWEETGKYPENIGMVLWSSPVMRNKGDDMAEILYLLGVEPVWESSSGRVVGLNPIPLDQLGRPRLDVTVRISGLYRDTFPQGIELLDRAVELVAALDEPEEMNYLRKHILADLAKFLAQGNSLEEAQERASYRIFGCSPGAYGAGIGKVLQEGNWQDLADLRQVYVTWGAFAYGRKTYGKVCPEEFTSRLSQLDLTFKNEDNRELNILDGDDYNAYHGGMIAAVRSLRGEAPKSYCGDSSNPKAVKIRALDEEIKLIFRSQVLNPQWIRAMQEHGYKAAGDFSALVSHCFEWDATSETMEDWMYDNLAEKYALDQEMQEWMKKVNPWALHSISEKLLEAIQRGMWEAKESTKKELQKLYLEMEGELEGAMGDF